MIELKCFGKMLQATTLAGVLLCPSFARSEPEFAYEQKGDALVVKGPGFIQTITGIDNAKTDQIRKSPDGNLLVVPYGSHNDCLALISCQRVHGKGDEVLYKATAVVDWRPLDSTVELQSLIPTADGYFVSFLTGRHRDVRCSFAVEYTPDGEPSWKASEAVWYGGNPSEPSIPLYYGQWVATHGRSPNPDVDPSNYKAFLRAAGESRK
jgi:hypothetical protein